MELREYTDFNQEEILSLYTSVGWENYTRNPQMLERAYENSFLKIAAFEGKQLIGMVRVVGDGASVILIQDLLVRPEYQRKGIGSQLMRAVLERCEDVYQIELMTDNSVQTMKNELHSDFLYEVYTQVNEYLTGRRKQFDVPLKYQGTQFQQSVWQELQKIPYGETRSYQEIAAVIGNEKAVRAVGQANNKNPILLIIPCHRVIHKSGDISGFACGVEVKRYLLELEKGMRI